MRLNTQNVKEFLNLLRLFQSAITAGGRKSDNYLVPNFPACVAMLGPCSAFVFPQLVQDMKSYLQTDSQHRCKRIYF